MSYVSCDKDHVSPEAIKRLEILIASKVKDLNYEDTIVLLEILSLLDDERANVVRTAIELLNGGPIRRRT